MYDIYIFIPIHICIHLSVVLRIYWLIHIYVCEYTSVLLCIYMHRESASDSEVDPIVKWIWAKV